jgi:hypothetical protein
MRVIALSPPPQLQAWCPQEAVGRLWGGSEELQPQLRTSPPQHELRASEKSKAVLISQQLSFMLFKQALPLLRFSSLRSTHSVTSFSIVQQRCFLSTPYKMSDLAIDLTAPNGKKFALPTGIFINNEFVKSKSGEKITSINPTLAALPLSQF